MTLRRTWHRQLYTPVEVSALLAVSLATIYRRIEDGTVPSIRVGKLLRVPVEEFHRLFPGLRPPRQLTFPFAG